MAGRSTGPATGLSQAAAGRGPTSRTVVSRHPRHRRRWHASPTDQASRRESSKRERGDLACLIVRVAAGTTGTPAGGRVQQIKREGDERQEAVMTVDGATDADVVRPSGKRVLGPTLAPGDRVVMENLRAHTAIGVQQTIARRGARLRSMPPYAPDLSLIEPCRSQVKMALRQAEARLREAPDRAITDALATATEEGSWMASTWRVCRPVTCKPLSAGAPPHHHSPQHDPG
jgi:transposase